MTTPTVSIRLSDHAYACTQAGAAAHNETVNAYMKRRWEEAMAKVAHPDVVDHCGHPKVRLVNGGLEVCVECEAIHGIDGAWRRVIRRVGDDGKERIERIVTLVQPPSTTPEPPARVVSAAAHAEDCDCPVCQPPG
jgi:ribosomal protein L37AE/L43A